MASKMGKQMSTSASLQQLSLQPSHFSIPSYSLTQHAEEPSIASLPAFFFESLTRPNKEYK